MGMVATQLVHIASINFTKPTNFQDVNGFETAIGYLCGLISVYDLICTSDVVSTGFTTVITLMRC